MSPQKEDGYTPIANELFEAFYRCKLLEYERCVVMCVWRKTYGWSKKDDWISNSQILEETGILLPNITRTIKSLVDKKIITKKGKKMCVNKRYEEWDVEWRRLSHEISKVISPDNQKLSHEIPTKTKSKYTKTIASVPLAGKENMAFKKYNESDSIDDIPTIDADTNQSVKKQIKPKRHFKEVYEIFNEVAGTLPLNWFVNKTQQISADNLYTERGLEQIKKALVFYTEHKDEEFCPQILSPYDLDGKWSKLNKFKIQNGY